MNDIDIEVCLQIPYYNEGIQVAQVHIGSSGFEKHIRLSSEITPEKSGCKAMFFMEDSQKIVSQWQK